MPSLEATRSLMASGTGLMVLPWTTLTGTLVNLTIGKVLKTISRSSTAMERVTGMTCHLFIYILKSNMDLFVKFKNNLHSIRLEYIEKISKLML